VRKGFSQLFNSGLEVFAVQILAPAEIDPDVNGDLRLVDSETEGILDVTSANDLLDLYQEYRLSYERRLATLCRQRLGRFVTINSEEPIEFVLFDLMRRKGWVQ